MSTDPVLNNAEDIPPNYGNPIDLPNSVDVLSGRGGRIAQHPGNIYFRELIRKYRPTYMSKQTKKAEKAKIAAKIVKTIRDMGGKFLKEVEDTSETGKDKDETAIVWVEIGDFRARKKTGQAMREKVASFNQQRKKGSTQVQTNPLQSSTSSTESLIEADNNSARIFTPTQQIAKVNKKQKLREVHHRVEMNMPSQPSALPDSFVKDCLSEILPSKKNLDQITTTATTHYCTPLHDALSIQTTSEIDIVDPILLSEIESSLDESFASIDQIGHDDCLCDCLREDNTHLICQQPKKRKRVSDSDSQYKRPKASQQAEMRRKQFQTMKFEASTLPSYPQSIESYWFSSLFQR